MGDDIDALGAGLLGEDVEEMFEIVHRLLRDLFAVGLVAEHAAGGRPGIEHRRAVNLKVHRELGCALNGGGKIIVVAMNEDEDLAALGAGKLYADIGEKLGHGRVELHVAEDHVFCRVGTSVEGEHARLGDFANRPVARDRHHDAAGLERG